LSKLHEPATLEDLQEILSYHEVVVVEFGAEWCGPCKKFLPHFEKFAELNPEVTCVKVDVDTDPGFIQEYGIKGVPQVWLFTGGEFVKQLSSRTVIRLQEEINA